jgi:hypothetical protein
MWDLFTNYAFTHPSVAEQLRRNKWEWPHRNAEGAMEWLGVKGYHNNFEIVKLEAFRRPDVMAWLDELMSVPERAYKWRWGKLFSRGMYHRSLPDLQEMHLYVTRQCSFFSMRRKTPNNFVACGTSIHTILMSTALAFRHNSCIFGRFVSGGGRTFGEDEYTFCCG